MEKDNESITLNIEDESRDYVGHIIIHEDPESPAATPPPPPPPPQPPTPPEHTDEPSDDISDNESGTSDDSVYHADTDIDSPTSNSSTLDLNTAENFTDESEVSEASSECNESDGVIQNFDETGFLFSPRYRPILKPKEESEDEM